MRQFIRVLEKEDKIIGVAAGTVIVIAAFIILVRKINKKFSVFVDPETGTGYYCKIMGGNSLKSKIFGGSIMPVKFRKEFIL